MKTGERYYNSTRGNQIIRLIEVNKQSVVYEVEQGNTDNKIKMFECTKKRFNNIYLKINLSTQQ